MHKSTRRFAILTAAVLPIVTLTTAALADDDKTYSGAMCRAVNNPAEAGINLTTGALLNQSMAEQTFICPAVRDHMVEDPEFARITVQENGSDPGVTCTFEVGDPDGRIPVPGVAGTKGDDKVILSTNPLQFSVRITWGSDEDEAFKDVPDHGYYFFRCKVPGMHATIPGTTGGLAGVLTYKVGEND